MLYHHWAVVARTFLSSVLLGESMKKDRFFSVEMPKAVAGFIVDKDTMTIRRAAPILKYLTGWTLTDALIYLCVDRRFKVMEIK